MDEPRAKPRLPSEPDRAPVDRPSVDRPSTERPSGDRPSPARPSPARPSSYRPSADRPYGASLALFVWLLGLVSLAELGGDLPVAAGMQTMLIVAMLVLPVVVFALLARSGLPHVSAAERAAERVLAELGDPAAPSEPAALRRYLDEALQRHLQGALDASYRQAPDEVPWPTRLRDPRLQHQSRTARAQQRRLALGLATLEAHLAPRRQRRAFRRLRDELRRSEL